MKGTSDLSNPYIHRIYTLVLMKHTFEKANRLEQRPKAGLSFGLELSM